MAVAGSALQAEPFLVWLADSSLPRIDWYLEVDRDVSNNAKRLCTKTYA